MRSLIPSRFVLLWQEDSTRKELFQISELNKVNPRFSHMIESYSIKSMYIQIMTPVWFAEASLVAEW